MSADLNIAERLSQGAEWLVDAETRGLVFAVDGDRLLVSPRASITEADRAFIVANKPLLLAFLASRPRPEASCTGICPGASHELCAGCADVTEYLMPDGLIVNGWCSKKLDVRSATHYRNRWDKNEWTPVAVEVSS